MPRLLSEICWLHIWWSTFVRILISNFSCPPICICSWPGRQSSRLRGAATEWEYDGTQTDFDNLFGLASRVSGYYLDTQTFKNNPSGHQHFFESNFLKFPFQAFIWLYWPQYNPMDIISYFDKWIHIYGCNPSILWFPLKNRMLKNFTIVTFGHSVFKS